MVSTHNQFYNSPRSFKALLATNFTMISEIIKLRSKDFSMSSLEIEKNRSCFCQSMLKGNTAPCFQDFTLLILKEARVS